MMSDRFLYVYLMKNEPDRIGEVVPRHVCYWQGLDLDGYLGGPFADHSGGSISFEAENHREAERLAARDPFVEEDLLRERWVKQWQIE